MESEKFIESDVQGMSGMYIVQPDAEDKRKRTQRNRRRICYILLPVLLIALVVGLGFGIRKAVEHFDNSGTTSSLFSQIISLPITTDGMTKSRISSTFRGAGSDIISPSATTNGVASSSSYEGASSLSSKIIWPSATTNGVASSSSYEVKIVSWSRWLGWSSCSVTCGGGVQTRTRVCEGARAVNYRQLCVGIATQSRSCSEWKCPDCTKVCKTGQLNSACNACVCTKNIFTGKVKNQDGVPLDNATIALAEFPFNILARTDVSGSFKVLRICVIEDNILITRTSYVSQTAKATQISSTKSTLTAVMIPIVFPAITIHPEGKLRLEGQAVTFCCKAEATPSPQYEWLINGRSADDYQHDVADGSHLIIPHMTRNMSGEVKCRAYSDYGAEFSNVAAIKILKQTNDSCDPKPSERITPLPAGCVHEETNSTTLDLGACRNEKCISNSLNNTNTCRDKNYCCQTKTQQQIKILCSSTVYISLTRITSCACGPCYSPKSTVRGVARGGPDDSPFKFGYIYLGDKYLTRTGRRGDFSFTVPSDVARLVVTFRDNDGYNNFLELTKVIPFSVGHETFVTVKMHVRPRPVRVNASKGFEIPLGGDSMNGGQQLPAVAAISMPPQSLMTEDGEHYNGTAVVTVSYTDPRNETQVQEADGDFTAMSEDGEQELLETFGVMRLDFRDSDGKKLEPNADIDVLFDPEKFNMTRDKAKAVKLWYMDEKTGRWRVMNSGLQQHESRRSRRSGRLFFFGKIERDKHYRSINLDRVATKCFLKIEVKDDVVKDGRSCKVTMTVSDRRYSNSYLETTMPVNSVKCTQTFCTETFATILVTLDGKYLVPNQGNISEIVIKEHGIRFHRFQESKDRFSNRITLTKLSRPIIWPSPFYSSIANCKQDTSNSWFIFQADKQKSFDEDLKFVGRLGDPDYWYPDIEASLCFVKIALDQRYCRGIGYFHVESFTKDQKSAGYHLISVSSSDPATCAEYKCPRDDKDRVTVKITGLPGGGHFDITAKFRQKFSPSVSYNHMQFVPEYQFKDLNLGVFHTVRQSIDGKNAVRGTCMDRAKAALKYHCS